MTFITDQQAEFDSRLQRIAARAQRRTQTIFVGEDEVYDIQRETQDVTRGKRSRGLGRLYPPFSLVLAVALGVLCHAAGMVLRFHLVGLRDWSDNPDLDMLAQVVVGFCLALVPGFFLRMPARRLVTLNLFGSVLGVLFFHNAVHQWPEAFASLTSPLWVGKLTAATMAHSLLWRGTSFPF